MENKPLRNDLFLYDLAIRVLAFWTTILFSLLFFTGAEASGKAELTKSDLNKIQVIKTIETNSEAK
jgi:hypothetical protein